MSARALAAVLMGTLVVSLALADRPTAAPQATSDKIPVTTTSEQARAEFLEARSLQERLLIQDSVQHLDKALTLDPNFALAELLRANASANGKDFLEHLNKAVALADKASKGERLLILSTQAGATGDAAKQKKYLDELVATHPRDERAHFNLGGYSFGQQDFETAITHYRKATELAPDYSPAYNILGYAYRQRGDYANAEAAFKKYIELIPKDPNPYDSYGELLLTMGRFEDSLAQYAKALAIDPNFIGSHLGRAANFMYMRKTAEATRELESIQKKARNDGERRTALFGLAVLAADTGNWDEAVKRMDEQYAIAQTGGDALGMAADLQAKGNILVEMGRYDPAKESFSRAASVVERSSVAPEFKTNARMFEHYSLARVALARGDRTTAETEAQSFSSAAKAKGNPAIVRQVHDLAGQLALHGKDYDKAITELEQASRQDAATLYRLCQAYAGKGDTARARTTCDKAAHLNPLPDLNFAFVRAKAAKMAGPSS